MPSWALEEAGLVQLESRADSMLGYMEPEERGRLVNEAISIAEQLGDDTHNNIRLTLRRVLRDL